MGDDNRTTDARVVDNAAEHRYELWLGDDRVGTLEYRLRTRAIVLVSTKVDPAFEGRGHGSRLVREVLADVRSRGLKVVPRCSFVRAYLRRHPAEADVLDHAPAADT